MKKKKKKKFSIAPRFSLSSSRKAALKVFFRWFLYSSVLLIFYLIESNPIIRGFTPMLLIPLATAVALFEGDFAAGVFGMFCGLMLDMLNASAVMGFYAIWLLCACPAVSLLSRFFVKVNLVSHLVMNAAVCVIIASLDMVFLHWVWEGEQSIISFLRVILPSYGGAIAFSAPIYLLIKLIVNKLRPGSDKLLDSAAGALSSQSASESAAEVEKK